MKVFWVSMDTWPPWSGCPCLAQPASSKVSASFRCAWVGSNAPGPRPGLVPASHVGAFSPPSDPCVGDVSRDREPLPPSGGQGFSWGLLDLEMGSLAQQQPWEG